MDGSESRPILFQILKGFFSWKINTFTGMYLSIDHSISFFFLGPQSTPSIYWFNLSYFWKVFLNYISKFLFCFSFSVPILQLSTSETPFMCLLDTFFSILLTCYFPTPVSHMLFIPIIFAPCLFLSSMGWVVSRSFYDAISHVTFISLMVLVFHPLFFLFLLLQLPLSVFSELL